MREESGYGLVSPWLAEGGTPERGNGGCSPPLLAERAHQTHRILRKAVLVQARSGRRINQHF